ncbi:hypothetical protein LTR36_002334 [Oleoguttula mirabilis]|uniref:HhH-GPD domain-containing protein n=1 Tax=Oleoguttula mirabilis TaxID=1507867 RepID=A0AAV9JLJ8_9PEZI|nr:hypothetical protein LTR36_002334 [Oleoguttula mirabilis]
MAVKRPFSSLAADGSGAGSEGQPLSTKKQKKKQAPGIVGRTSTPAKAAAKSAPVATTSHSPTQGAGSSPRRDSSIRASLSGLTKSQRKKRNKLLRQNGPLPNATSELASDAVAQPATGTPSSSPQTHTPSAKRQARRHKSRASDPGLLRRATATRLLVPPEKRWIDGQQQRDREPRGPEFLRRVTSTTLQPHPTKHWSDGRVEGDITTDIASSSVQAASRRPNGAPGKRFKSSPEQPQTERPSTPPFGSETAIVMRELESPDVNRQQTARAELGVAYSESPATEQAVTVDEKNDQSSVESASDDDAGNDAEMDLRVGSPAARPYGSVDAPAQADPVAEDDGSDGESSGSTLGGDLAGDAGPQHSVEPSAARAQVAESEKNDKSSVDSSSEDDGSEVAEIECDIKRSTTQALAAMAVPGRDDIASLHDAHSSTMRRQAVEDAVDSAPKKAAPVFQQSSVGSHGATAQLYGSIHHRLVLAPLPQPKANSAPNNTSKTEDVSEVFKRFSAMVRRGNGGGSDDDDDDDEDDSGDDESESSSDGDGSIQRRQQQAGVTAIVAGKDVQAEQPKQTCVETAAETKSESESESESASDSEAEVSERPATSWSAINHVHARQESVAHTEDRGEGQEAETSDELSDEDAEDDDEEDDVDERPAISALDGSCDVQTDRMAPEEVEDPNLGEDASVSDSDDELANESVVVPTSETGQARNGYQPQPRQREDEIENSSEDDDLESSVRDDAAESTTQVHGSAMQAANQLPSPGAADVEARSSLQPQDVPHEIIDISSESERDLDSSDEDADDTQELVDSPMESVKTITPPHAAQLKNELAAASQTSIPAPSQTRVETKKRVSFLDQQTRQVGFGQAPMHGLPETARPAVPSILDDGDDDEDVYKMIDEVSEHLFASTRPLPPCKPEQFATDAEDTRLTDSRHYDRVAADVHRRVATEVSIPKAPLLPAENVVRCYSVRVPEFEHDAVLGAQRSLGVYVESVDEGRPQTPASDDHAAPPLERTTSSSSLSELSRTPSPPPQLLRELEARGKWREDEGSEYAPAAEVRKKRRMTGMTSKHFSPAKRTKRRSSRQVPATEASSEEQQVDVPDETGVDDAAAATEEEAEAAPLAAHTPSPQKRPTKPKRKSTGTKSEHFLPFHLLDRVDLPTPTTKGRVIAGVSRAPVPPITSERFGIIQEKLWDQPFWLLIAVTFLNKTTGRAAVPTFWALKEKYPTPEVLAEADQGEIHDMIHHLGFQTQRSKRLIKMAVAWLANPPVFGKRYKTTNYPVHGDHKAYNRMKVVEEDAAECKGALEIGHIPGCGAYAWDSWRMYCRDVLRGVADDHNGKGAREEGFQPEWRKVLAGDKELRATLRWMWLREGWIWDCETGGKRRASEEEMERAVRGQMDVADAGEGKFAAQAAGVVAVEDAVVGVLKHEEREVGVGGGDDIQGQNAGIDDGPRPDESSEANVAPQKPKGKRSRRSNSEIREQDAAGSGSAADEPAPTDASEEIAVAPKPTRKAARRSSRRTTIA